MDWEDERHWKEMEEEVGYWLDWADGLLADPEPWEETPESRDEEAPESWDWENPPLTPHEMEEILALAPAFLACALPGLVRELESQAGVFQEGLVQAKLHALRFILLSAPISDAEPLMQGAVRDGESMKRVELTKAELIARIEGWLELYNLDFPSQAYEEMKAFRRWLELVSWKDSPVLDLLLELACEVWERLETLPSLQIPPWALPWRRSDLVRRAKERLLKRAREGDPNAADLIRLLEESGDLYELAALEALLGLAEGE